MAAYSIVKMLDLDWYFKGTNMIRDALCLLSDSVHETSNY